MAQASVYKFKCNSCKQVIAEVKGNACSLKGNATIVSNFPPQNWNSNWIKCSKCNQFAAIEGTNTSAVYSNTTTITATLGGTKLVPGDWLMKDGTYGSSYKHHFIYIGNGQFVSFQTSGVKLEGKVEYNGVKAWLIYRGGQSAADKARAQIGNGGYNLATNNCEHFASACCGLGHKSNQVIVSLGKAVVVGGSQLAKALGISSNVFANPNVKVTGNYSGGFSSMGSFSVGFSVSF
eukprot:78640_1